MMKAYCKPFPICLARLVAALMFLGASANASASELYRWEPPYSYAGRAIPLPYQPSALATKPWSLCVVFPHVKDAYWLAVDYGMVEEARRLGVKLRILEAWGYANLQRQRGLLQECADMTDVDAIILGSVSFAGLSDAVKTISRHKPIFATVNDIANDGLSGKVGVPWYDMGHLIGRYLVNLHQNSDTAIPIAWFPGPRAAGWVPFVDRGFRDAIKNTPIQIVTTGWGDTDKSVQRNLVQVALGKHPDIRYLVGNAMMAEAAVSIVREKGLEQKKGILSTYFTPGVYRGIARNKILAAPTDLPVLQGRLSIAQAVDMLEGRNYTRHIGPVIQVVDHDALRTLDLEESISPPTFSPQFEYRP
ncbi:MAG: TMAO reductase system periplasmic protein TorT [Rhodoferax sp.]|nr:TMAO reductase system periplasmic protein TorT [Rhodoferax sp.]